MMYLWEGKGREDSNMERYWDCTISEIQGNFLKRKLKGKTKHKYCVLVIHMWNLENGIDVLICNPGRDTDVENKGMDTQGEGDGVG